MSRETASRIRATAVNFLVSTAFEQTEGPDMLRCAFLVDGRAVVMNFSRPGDMPKIEPYVIRMQRNGYLQRSGPLTGTKLREDLKKHAELCRAVNCPSWIVVVVDPDVDFLTYWDFLGLLLECRIDSISLPQTIDSLRVQ